MSRWYRFGESVIADAGVAASRAKQLQSKDPTTGRSLATESLRSGKCEA